MLSLLDTVDELFFPLKCKYTGTTIAAAIVNNSAERRTILTKGTICLIESILIHEGRRECE